MSKRLNWDKVRREKNILRKSNLPPWKDFTPEEKAEIDAWYKSLKGRKTRRR